MPDWSDLWWTSITGPHNLTISVKHALDERYNVYLIVPDDLPWRSGMRACIEDELHQIPDMESFLVEFIDVEDECPEITDVGGYLLDRFASPDVAAGYRGRETKQKYLLDNQILKNRILWVKGMNARQEQLWIQFCKEYVPSRNTDGRFVLELRWSDTDIEGKAFIVISYNDMITPHDLTLFNSIYMNREKFLCSPIWQKYVAILCAMLCNTDAEISHALIEDFDFTKTEALDNLYALASEDYFSRRGESNSNHILSMARNKDATAIEKQIWKAQLQVFFPLIEIERISLIEAFRERIKEALGTKYYDQRTEKGRLIHQFGETVDNPDNAELGTIYRMMHLKRDEDYYQYLLYIPFEKSRSRVELLHNLRNKLAHGNICSIEEITEFIDHHPFVWNK